MLNLHAAACWCIAVANRNAGDDSKTRRRREGSVCCLDHLAANNTGTVHVVPAEFRISCHYSALRLVQVLMCGMNVCRCCALGSMYVKLNIAGFEVVHIRRSVCGRLDECAYLISGDECLQH